MFALAVALAAGVPWVVAGADTTTSRPDDTWVALGALPEDPVGPVVALAADPADAARVLVGTPRGTVYRSGDGGGSWTLAKAGLGRAVTVLAFDLSGGVLAGTRGGGAWRSTDGGQSWRIEPGTEGRTIRSFAFEAGLAMAGTDQGVLASHGGGPWAPEGLGPVAVSAVAVGLAGDPSRALAGGDADAGGTGSSPPPGGVPALALYSSGDGGGTWTPVTATVGGSTIVSVIGDGTRASQGGPHPLLMGTNAGLFGSGDYGSTWQPVTGDGTLPATDVTDVVYEPGHDDRYYVASDGGGSDRGGLWVTRDSGGHFATLRPPSPAVTALAVSGAGSPVLYAATLRPGDQAVGLWAYSDAGGALRGVVGGPTPVAGTSQSRTGGSGARGSEPARLLGSTWLAGLMRAPEAPYVGLGALALVAVLAALAAYLRRARDL
jgi:hypothetical protein